MISHDAFLVLSALVDLDGEGTEKELTKLVDNRVQKLSVKECLEELVKLNLVSLHISLYKLIDSLRFIEAYRNYTQPIKKESNKAYSSAINSLLKKSVKMSNTNYRAVVDGKRPRRSPLHEYAEKNLSRQDIVTFWKELGDMTENERRDISDKITRMAARSR